ncbi:basic amino acid ABC transporter substrate-binding protein [Conchiformibius kuhniae]|uniref:Basic amino acid ABC transporter substrate-binding protein n=1 Tax=Conchiformibius kuhniae TaxID=211502 RepID=A0A8T9MZN4_9NEIS|nr:basic amino acid ABC transporter substrate-binding protein [Conchiformibius kuhniae]UOP05662.1 basic amino acid ABC transporter substrate-binding protein [Conchiformibius kuhniae]
MLNKTALFGILSALLLGACSEPQQSAPAASAAHSPNTDKTYIVATDASYAPMEYMENDQVVGFSRDILDAAAKSQNLKLDFVNAPFEGLFANVNKGDSDIALASITITDERKQQLDFSEPYFEATQMIVFNEGAGKNIQSFADLKTRSVSVQAATSGDLIMQDLQGKQSTQIKRFENMPLAFKELQTGGADAVVGDSSVVEHYVQQNPDAKLATVIDPSFVKEQYGFAFRKGRDDGLREAVNKGLAHIRNDGTYAQIHAKWFGNKQDGASAPASAASQ